MLCSSVFDVPDVLLTFCHCEVYFTSLLVIHGTFIIFIYCLSYPTIGEGGEGGREFHERRVNGCVKCHLQSRCASIRVQTVPSSADGC